MLNLNYYKVKSFHRLKYLSKLHIKEMQLIKPLNSLLILPTNVNINSIFLNSKCQTKQKEEDPQATK